MTEQTATTELMLRYASLGENCEFGFAQRCYKAEPIDMFRWASTPISSLIKIFEDDFAGISDNISIAAKQGDYTLAHDRYNFRWHAFADPAKVDPEKVL